MNGLIADLMVTTLVCKFQIKKTSTSVVFLKTENIILKNWTFEEETCLV